MWTPTLAVFALPGGLSASALLIYLTVCLALPLAALWRPTIGIYVLVPLMPLQTTRYQIQVLPWGDKLVDALLFAVLFGLTLHRGSETLLPRIPLNRFLLLFCAFLYVMLWFGSYRSGLPLPLFSSDDRLANWKNLVEMPLLYVCVAASIRTKKQVQILLALMMISLLRVDLGFYHTLNARHLSHFTNNLRYAGALGYAGQNGFAAFVTECLIFLLAISGGISNIWAKCAVLVGAASAGYGVLFGFSRGAYLGLLAGLLFLGIVKQRRYLVVVCLLLATWQTIVPSAVRERILMTYDGNEVESSARERLDLWQDALTIIPEHPILGTGFDTYRLLGRNADYLDTHNYYVKVMVETGAVGLVAFMTLLLLMWREGFLLFRESDDLLYKNIGLGFAAVMVCVVVVNCFGDRWMYQQLTAYMWVILGIVVRARAVAECKTASLATARQDATLDLWRRSQPSPIAESGGMVCP